MQRYRPRARALAILEHDVLLLLSPPNKKIKSLAQLKKKKIAVLADGDHNAAFVRKSWKFPIIPTPLPRSSWRRRIRRSINCSHQAVMARR